MTEKEKERPCLGAGVSVVHMKNRDGRRQTFIFSKVSEHTTYRDDISGLPEKRSLYELLQDGWEFL